ncbi:MAG: hypothetical protein JO328_15860 [Hyphomicrobiales bacterium]|nr:hypothetical protein [Hyphomicrobiales bacterium]MBV8824237.1 hypothetical protein [Hyphomicrobiales bacterium]MBV9428607.1 hypothetical protein [Bradyrhizobiaceae bacterium]
MSRSTVLALAAALTFCAAPAFADSIDGKPFERVDGRPRISVDGAPSILFEDRSGPGPLDTCASDDGYTGARPCGARGAF